MFGQTRNMKKKHKIYLNCVNHENISPSNLNPCDNDEGKDRNSNS